MGVAQQLAGIQQKRESVSKEIESLENKGYTQQRVKIGSRYVYRNVPTEKRVELEKELTRLNELEKQTKAQEKAMLERQMQKEDRPVERAKEREERRESISKQKELAAEGKREEYIQERESYEKQYSRMSPVKTPESFYAEYKEVPVKGKEGTTTTYGVNGKELTEAEFKDQTAKKFQQEFTRKQALKQSDKINIPPETAYMDVPIIQYTKQQRKKYEAELSAKTKDKTSEQLIKEGVIRPTTKEDINLAPYKYAYTDKTLMETSDKSAIGTAKPNYSFGAETITLKSKIKDAINVYKEEGFFGVLKGGNLFESQQIEKGLGFVGLDKATREKIYPNVAYALSSQPGSKFKLSYSQSKDIGNFVGSGIEYGIRNPFLVQGTYLLSTALPYIIGYGGQAVYGATSFVSSKLIPATVRTSTTYIAGTEITKGVIASGLKFGVPAIYASNVGKRIIEQPTREQRIGKAGEIFFGEIVPFGLGSLASPKEMPGRNILEEGTQIKFRSVTVPSKEGTRTVFKGLTFDYKSIPGGKEVPLIGYMGGRLSNVQGQILYREAPTLVIGKSKFIEKIPASKVSTKPDKFELVTFEEGYALESPLQTQIISQALPTYTPLESKSIASMIFKEGFTGIAATSGAIKLTSDFFGGGTATLKSAFVQPKYTRTVEAFKAETEGITDVLEFTKSYSGYTYGSSAAKSQAPTEIQLASLKKQGYPVPEEPLRGAADIDVMFPTQTTESLSPLVQEELIPTLKSRGLPFTASKDNPLLIETTRKDLPSHAVDIHTSDTAAEDILSPAFAKDEFMGFSINQPRISMEKGYKVQPFSEQLLRKGASSFTLRSMVLDNKPIYFFAPEKHRAKDIVDFFEEGENLILSYSKQGITRKNVYTKKREELGKIKELFDERIFEKKVPSVSDKEISSYKAPKSKSSLSSLGSLLLPKSASPSRSKSPSRSLSPSLSISPSISLSPSPSISPSLSPSKSISKSSSPSRSKSPSRSLSPSLSISPSISLSPSPSISPSLYSLPKPPSTPPQINKQIKDQLKFLGGTFKKSKKKRKYNYRPTVFSIGTGRTGKDILGGTLSGLGLRPIKM